MSSPITRREFLKMAGPAAATVALAACSEQPTPTTEDRRLANHQQIDALKVYPLLPPARFNEYQAAMSQSSSPLLRHLVTGLAALWQGPRPSAIPPWVSPVITPLVVTTDTSRISLCVAEAKFGYDPNVIEMINAGAILNIIKDGQKSLLWRLYDGLPTAILSQHLHHHLGKDIPLSTTSLSPFVTAGIILARPEHRSAQALITDLANQWASSASLSPPDNYLMVMLNKGVGQAIEEIQAGILPSRPVGVQPVAISVVGQSPPFVLPPQLLSQPV